MRRKNQKRLDVVIPSELFRAIPPPLAVTIYRLFELAGRGIQGLGARVLRFMLP